MIEEAIQVRPITSYGTNRLLMMLRHATQEKERELAEAEKKRPQMKAFDSTTTISSYIASQPSQYALRCLEEFNFVELWYSTPKGCADASLHHNSQGKDTFG